MYELDFTQEEEILTEKQNRLVDMAINNINKIVDLNGLKNWCNKNKVNELIVFGSRAILCNKEDSDLDIMVNSFEIEGVNNENFIKLQREAVNMLYKSFIDYVRDESIELDFKLNTSQDNSYFGITYGTQDSKYGEPDFDFEWVDVPSYISITADNIKFTFADSLKNVFDEVSFID